MSENAYFAFFFFPSLALVLIFGMKYVAAMVQAKAHHAHDEAYRELASKAASAQAATEAALTSIQAQLAGLEKILKEVE